MHQTQGECTGTALMILVTWPDGRTMRLCMRCVRSSNSSGMLAAFRLRCLAARAAAPGDL